MHEARAWAVWRDLPITRDLTTSTGEPQHTAKKPAPRPAGRGGVRGEGAMMRGGRGVRGEGVVMRGGRGGRGEGCVMRGGRGGRGEECVCKPTLKLISHL